MHPTMKFAVIAAETTEAHEAQHLLAQRYTLADPDTADIVIALGGDGTMLETLHRSMNRQVPIYGMNCGTVGFLMNSFDVQDLPARIARAERVELHPLRMRAHRLDGSVREGLAINEVSLLRETRQAAKLAIHIDGRTRLAELICDGVLVCTAAGSTAYNLSAHGPIIPIGANILGLTPISAFRPRRWRGALLPHDAQITVDVLEADKRPVSAVADFTEVRDVRRVEVREDRDSAVHLLFDPEHNLEERILLEQFEP